MVHATVPQSTSHSLRAYSGWCCAQAQACICVSVYIRTYYFTLKNSQNETPRHSPVQSAYTLTLLTLGARLFFGVRVVLCPTCVLCVTSLVSPPPPHATRTFLPLSSCDNPNDLQTTPRAPRARTRLSTQPKRPQPECGLALLKAFGPRNESNLLSQITMNYSQNHLLCEALHMQ